MSRSWLIVGLLGLVPASPGAAQGGLDAVVQGAREAWAAHDTRALVSTSDTVRLRIPEVAAAQSLRPAQAARILSGFLADAHEISLELRDVRYVADDHAYAELAREFLVRGTEDRHTQTVFLGFRRIEGVWRLREVRVTT